MKGEFERPESKVAEAIEPSAIAAGGSPGAADRVPQSSTDPRPILRAKLHPPSVRRGLVARPRLVERFEGGTGRKLTLVTAPAGFGKTTLLAEWHATSAGARMPLAWLSLDDGDNDPERFWSYAIAALQTIEADFGQSALSLLRSSQSVSFETVLTTLINELDLVPHSFVLVLDDYHAIGEETIHRGVDFLLEHLPVPMHLVVISRSDPPLALSRLRSRAELEEIRAADLRFTIEEAAAFFEMTMGLQLAADDVAALGARTEGWVTGLQLAALSMRGREDVTAFVAAFSGSNRHVLDYLAEQVLEQQPSDVQDFLLQTAILDRLSGPLCRALTGREESQALLETFERSNLFIMSLDDERRWYRYHPLFAEFLRARLREAGADRPRRLHRRASDWLAERGYADEAVRHALAAPDFERAARLIERPALGMLLRNQWRTVDRWLQALPDEVVRARPRLALARAWCTHYGSDLDAVEPSLAAAERSLDLSATETEGERPRSDGEDDIARSRGEVAALRAGIAAFQANTARAVELCEQALDRISDDDLFLRGRISVDLGIALARGGDTDGAIATLARASDLNERAGNYDVAVASLALLAQVQADHGGLRRAADTYRRAIALAESRGRRPLAGGTFAHGGLGQILYERNDLEAALHQLTAAIDLAKAWAWQPGDIAIALLARARVDQVRGTPVDAPALIEKTSQILRGSAVVYYEGAVTAAQVRLLLASGEVEAAGRLMRDRGYAAGDELTYPREAAHIALARLGVAEGGTRSDPVARREPLELLNRLADAAGKAARAGRLIEISVLQAVVLAGQNERGAAMSALGRALSLAEPEGYVRMFLDEGVTMASLLREAAARGMAPRYAAALLAAFDTKGHLADADGTGETELLTARELEVLRLIAAGLSNQQIAESLIITLNTVRTHTKNTYSKLAVRSRTQAVARARELDLL